MLPLRRMNTPLPHDTVVPDRDSEATKKEQVAHMDVATGTADLALLAEKILQPDTLLGIDISSQMLAVGQEKIQRANKSSRIRLESGDAEAIKQPDQSFDLVMVAYGIRNFQDLHAGLKEMLRVLRPGGKLLILEFSRPRNPIWKRLYQFYMKRYVPTLAGWMGQDKKAYAYLDESARLFPEREELVSILEDAGYSNPSYKTYTGGICARYLASRPL